MRKFLLVYFLLNSWVVNSQLGSFVDTNLVWFTRKDTGSTHGKVEWKPIIFKFGNSVKKNNNEYRQLLYSYKNNPKVWKKSRDSYREDSTGKVYQDFIIKEQLVFDWNAKEEDILSSVLCPRTVWWNDTIEVNGTKRRYQYNHGEASGDYVIEGIGGMLYSFEYYNQCTDDATGPNILCVFSKDSLIYRASGVKECFTKLSTSLSSVNTSKVINTTIRKLTDIKLIDEQDVLKLEIITISGEKVGESKTTKGLNGNVSSGIYIMRIFRKKGGMETVKLLVVN